MTMDVKFRLIRCKGRNQNIIPYSSGVKEKNISIELALTMNKFKIKMLRPHC